MKLSRARQMLEKFEDVSIGKIRQTIQWPPKRQRTNNDLQNTTQKTKYQQQKLNLKPEGEHLILIITVLRYVILL